MKPYFLEKKWTNPNSVLTEAERALLKKILNKKKSAQ